MNINIVFLSDFLPECAREYTYEFIRILDFFFRKG